MKIQSRIKGVFSRVSNLGFFGRRQSEHIETRARAVMLLSYGVFWVLVAVFVMNVTKVIVFGYEKTGLVKQMEDEVSLMRYENLRLSSELEYLDSEEFVEDVARDQLSYTRPGETLVLVEDIRDEERGQDTQGMQVNEEKANWQRWVDLVIYGPDQN